MSRPSNDQLTQHGICPKCKRTLVREPDGSLFCLECIRPTLWGNVVSILEPSEGWQEIGWIFRGLLGATFFAAGAVLWSVVMTGDGYLGLKGATGAVLLSFAIEAIFAFVAGMVLRSVLPMNRTNLLVSVWCACMVLIPGLTAFVQAAPW